jgi:hypothetical protein
MREDEERQVAQVVGVERGAFLTHPDGVIEYGHCSAAILLD